MRCAEISAVSSFKPRLGAIGECVSRRSITAALLVLRWHASGGTGASFGRPALIDLRGNHPAEATVDAESSTAPGLAATLPVGAAVSGIATAGAIQTGVGLVRELNTDVREGAEDTAKAIVELMEPRLEQMGWIDD